MAYRNGNYSAFYVKTPFNQNNLSANSTKDFVYYNLLKAWKGSDSTFPFNDSHSKNYNVRDGSDWEKTLKPRLHSRLGNSKNIVLFLSSATKNSKALREEIDYGINTKGLPVIIVYPDFSEKSDIIICGTESIEQKVKNLWENLPIFKNSMSKVPTLHIPNKKALIKSALNDSDFIVSSKISAGEYCYKC
jgi:hypothetical protein